MKTLNGKGQENSYDGEGLRAGLTENGKKTTFLYHNGEILTEFDGESAPIKRYLRGIGLSHVQTQDSEAYHAYHQDEQGSTAFITGQGRETENIYQYDAFGNLLEKREDVGNRILYTAQQYDQETGQYYLRARYYNPEVGRFLQEDTYRGDGLNLYAYCANNPVVYYDPSGHGVTYEEGGVQGSENTQAGQLVNGSSMKTDDALDLATDFLGEGYTEQVLGSGRFVSEDGTRVFRMGESDITGRHGGGPHVNFEILAPNPEKPGKMQVIGNIHIYLED